LQDIDFDAASTTTTKEQVPVPQPTTIELQTTVPQPTTIELETTIFLSTTVKQETIIFQPTTIDEKTTIFSLTTSVSELFATLTEITTIQETLTAPPIVLTATSVIEETVSFPFLSTVERTIVQPPVSVVYSSLNNVVTQTYAFTATTTEPAQQAAPPATGGSISVLYSLSEDTITQSFFLTETIIEPPLLQTTTTTAVVATSLSAEFDSSLPKPTTQVTTTTAMVTVMASSESSPSSSTSCPDPCAVNVFATELIYPTRVETSTTTVITATRDTLITVLPDGSEITSFSTRTVLTLDPNTLASPASELMWTDDKFPGVIL